MIKIIIKLKKMYLYLIIPIVFYLLVGVFCLFTNKFNLKFSLVQNRIVVTVFLIATALFNFIMPLWQKINLFTKVRKKQKKISFNEYLKYQELLLMYAFLGGYLAIIAYIISIPKIPLVIIIITGIYSLYFYYPSSKRVNFDKKILNLEFDDEKNN